MTLLDLGAERIVAPAENPLYMFSIFTLSPTFDVTTTVEPLPTWVSSPAPMPP
ncbi:MAG: hypothetical protein M3Y05_07755 [Gemmatimonadota bacterium]|nr:hypothetical protein [Gemmatimonadota bacterium]